MIFTPLIQQQCLSHLAGTEKSIKNGKSYSDVTASVSIYLMAFISIDLVPACPCLDSIRIQP